LPGPRGISIDRAANYHLQTTMGNQVMAVSAPAIEVDRIRKAYGPTIALDDVSVTIEAGRVHA